MNIPTRSIEPIPVLIDGKEALKIPLTRGVFALIDIEDFDKVKDRYWQVLIKKTCCYAVTGIRTLKGRKKLRMHNVILLPEKGFEIDHRNHDGLDNRKSNLRESTKSQNCAHARKCHKKTASVYKGVSFDKRVDLWKATINKKNRCGFLGYFSTEKEAATAYNKACIKVHGEFGVLNNLGQN